MSGYRIHDKYFGWLGEQVDPERQYTLLTMYIHGTKDFYWELPMDQNREGDGAELRDLFLAEVDESAFSQGDVTTLLEDPTVSVMEVLVAIVRRMDHELDDLSGSYKLHLWFQELLNNIGLADLTDDTWIMGRDGGSESVVDEALEIWLSRTYDSRGVGSIFPVSNSEYDMRTVEMWYQMMAYLDRR